MSKKGSKQRFSYLAIERGVKVDLKSTPYWGIWAMACNFHKRYCNVSNADEYWREVVEEASKVCEPYKGTPEQKFAQALMLVTIDELERLSKQGEEKRNEEKN